MTYPYICAEKVNLIFIFYQIAVDPGSTPGQRNKSWKFYKIIFLLQKGLTAKNAVMKDL
jgi:hypothetical protein